MNKEPKVRSQPPRVEERVRSRPRPSNQTTISSRSSERPRGPRINVGRWHRRLCLMGFARVSTADTRLQGNTSGHKRTLREPLEGRIHLLGHQIIRDSGP